MSYIARLATDPQHGPTHFYDPDITDGFLLPPMFFITDNLVYPTTERAEFTFTQAMRRKSHYDANKSHANYRAYSRACYTHNLLACGCKYEFDRDSSCCSEYDWLRCPCKMEGKAQFLLTFNDEFGPEVTPLVPNDCADPYEQHKDILALLYHCYFQTQHPTDHARINARIKHYTMLAGQPATVKPLPIRDVLI